MKKCAASIILAAVMFSFSAMIFANSGPVYWKGYPSSDIMSVEKDSPIAVKNENLIFDFSDNDDSSYTVSGKVKATYKMVNPTKEAQAVKMAFPFAGRLDNLSPDDIVITADKDVMPYGIYIGDVVDSYGNPSQEDKDASFDFAGIIGTISDEPYTAKSFKENEKGKLYTISVNPAADQRVNFVVDFNFDYDKTRVLTDGFNRYERDNDKTRIAAWCYEPEVLEIFVLGEDIDLKVSAYTDGELKEKTDLYTHQISSGSVEVKQYLMEYIRENTGTESSGKVFEAQLYNLYAKSLDKYFTQNMGYSSKYDLEEQNSYERIITLVYTVDFPENSEREVSISYDTSGTMDKTQTTKPMYSFDYILNPAENWSDFRNLNIEIITPQEAPYIIKSSIELLKGEDNVYKAALPDLPEHDLFFTLYADEKVTLLDKVGGNLRNSFGYFASFVTGVTVLITAAIVILVIILKRKNKY